MNTLSFNQLLNANLSIKSNYPNHLMPKSWIYQHHIPKSGWFSIRWLYHYLMVLINRAIVLIISKKFPKNIKNYFQRFHYSNFKTPMVVFQGSYQTNNIMIFKFIDPILNIRTNSFGFCFDKWNSNFQLWVARMHYHYKYPFILFYTFQQKEFSLLLTFPVFNNCFTIVTHTTKK